MPTARENPEPAAAFTLFIDGLCPLCTREAALLGRLDRRGRLGFVDIAAADFDERQIDRPMHELMGTIHAIDADGTVVTGVEAFRRAYAEVGLGWLLAPTGWPVLRPLSDAAYRVFARIRPRLRGACDAGRCRRGISTPR